MRRDTERDAAPMGLPMETSLVVDDGRHNAFTDLLFWRNWYWLVRVSSPTHFRSAKSRLVLLRSRDAREWEEVRRFDGAGEDIRDPKFGLIGGRLFLYALLNRRFDPEPYRTVVASSTDGLAWTPFQSVSPEGWLLGRPVGSDGKNWYAPAHRLDRGEAALLQSADGIHWSLSGTIRAATPDGAGQKKSAGERADETAIHLLADGRMLAVTRMESGGGLFGSLGASTLVSVASPPFSEWKVLGQSMLTRLDGPSLFAAAGSVFALGRRQTRVRGPFERQGSAFGRKRTALFRVDENTGELAHVCDLPSSGDTSYAAAVVAEGKVLISYYSSDPRRDHPWLLGMLLPTRIQLSTIALSDLSRGRGIR